MKDLQNILTQISITNKKNDELIDALGGRFNLFKLLGVNHYENTHSSILAELLNPRGSHGLKSKFLHAFINGDNLQGFASNFDFQNSTVQTEASTRYGRIDILIEDKKGHAIIIENKIYAADQFNQLKRYDEFAIKQYGKLNYKIFYLTLDGSEASKQSSGDIDYIPISYSDYIILWLEQCLYLSSRFPLVRETISQYINHLKKLTNQDMDTKNKEDIIKILSSSKENIQAAFSILENIGALKDFIIFNYFNTQLKEIAIELNINVSNIIENRRQYAGFGFNIPEWKFFYIGFDFEANDLRNLIYYFKLNDTGIDLKESTVILFPKFYYHNSNTTIPCGFSNMPIYPNWGNDAFLAICSGEMKNEIKRVVVNMLEWAEGLEM